MKHQIFKEADTYPIAILINSSSFQKIDLINSYVTPLGKLGVPDNRIIAFTLEQGTGKKPSASIVKEYLVTLLKTLKYLGVRFLYVADATYFKTLTGQTKAEPHLGYLLPCKIKDYEHMQVVLGLNHRQLIFNPDLQPKLDLSLKTLVSGFNGSYTAIGTTIVHSENYPNTVQKVTEALQKLHQYPRLTVDVETFSLRIDRAGLASIAFAWDQHNGIAFAVECQVPPENDPNASYSYFRSSAYKLKEALRTFFEEYKGELIFHNAAFDVKVLVWQLWMDHPLHREGMLTGLEVLTKRMHDTKLIAYLATNSTAGNSLGLKALAHEFAGNYAVEVKDITKVFINDLLKYNLTDTLCTWYVFNKYIKYIEDDNQGDLYRGLFLDSLKLIIQMELVGMPMSSKRVQEVKKELRSIVQEHIDYIDNSIVIKEFTNVLRMSTMIDVNAKLKQKQHPIESFDGVAFNPNSNLQLQGLLYEHMGLPVLDYTDKKAPATGASTIEKLVHHTENQEHKALLLALIGYGKVVKILNTFITAFEDAIEKDGTDTVWLHGNFNVTGTVSGRLSSSAPNMQNLPSGSMYGKLIKSCFVAPKGWLMVGADFNALEDRINALLTKDPNKLKIYLEGYDSHSLRTKSYWPSQIPDIIETVDSINSIGSKYPALRSKSKTVSFALAYAGTYHTLVKNLGFSMEEAKDIEASYHKLYEVSDRWVDARIQDAVHKGYSTGAFGLRIRTPLLKQVVWGSARMPHEAEAEARSLGNAISGQSYGLLNSRAAAAFMEVVKASPYRLDVMPIALIHDAIYLLVKDEVGIVEFVNNELIKAMSWQELPEIQHDEVKLTANLDIYYPSWAVATTLPNNVNCSTIIKLCENTKKELSGNPKD